MTLAIETRGLCRTFSGGLAILPGRKPPVHAVQDVDLRVAAGETLGVVGESGCGKSTLARMLVGLDRPTAGSIRLWDREISGRGVPLPAREIQYVFQDPIASLNPRKTVRQSLEAPMYRLLHLDSATRKARLAPLLEAVGLAPELLQRFPHEISGGQAQRIALARALAAEARVMVLDEPVSSLDVSVQAQVLNLLGRLKRDFGLTYVFISHDLGVIESICQQVAVMYFGRIVEQGPVHQVFSRPRHPYTQLLLRSAPVIGRQRATASDVPDDLPDPRRPPPGCAFAARCRRATDDCRQRRPPLAAADGRSAACWHPLGATD